MVRNLLEVGRLEESQLEVHREPAAIDAIVQDVIESANMQLIRPGITVDLQMEPATLLLDRAVIERVVANLLDGALKYSRSNDTISFSGCIDPQAKAYTIRLADNGPSIPERYREVVVDKFHQVEAKEAGVPRGLALGLVYCRMATQAHGGRIWIEGVGDRGNTYCITLPLADSVL